jgi:outer membrane cobalamin receptor
VRSIVRIGCAVVISIPLLLSPTTATAQAGSVTGRIVDATSGRPIAGAQVLVDGSEISAVTQQSGAFSLVGVPAGPRRVRVRRIGYEEMVEDVTIAADAASPLDFGLRVEPLRLDDLVVTGTPLPRGTRRRAIGNAVTTVPVADIQQDAPATTFQELLSGRASGLRFTRLSGNLGTGSPLSLRGIGSFDLGRSQPLVYVDGIRVNTDVAAGPPIGPGRSVNVLDDFGLEEIETVEIIQGAAAGSLYGSDAASGIIHIITRKGQLGPPELTASVRQGTNYLADPAGRIGTQYYCPTQPVPQFSLGVPCTHTSQLGSYNMYDEATRYIREGYFDWPTPELFSNGTSRSLALSVRGGTPATRYFLSAGFDDEQGMLFQNRDETARFRGNVGVTLNERFVVDVSTGYVTGRTSFMDPIPSDGGIWQDLVWSNGYYLHRVTPFGTVGNCTGPGCAPSPRTGGFQERLPTDVAVVETTREYTRLTGSATVSFASPTFELGPVSAAVRSRAVAGMDKGWDVNRNLFPRHDPTVPDNLSRFCRPIACPMSSWRFVDPETFLGTMNYERPVATSTTAEVGVTIDLGLGAVSTATSVGVQYYEQDRELFANWGSGFASFESRTINQISQDAITTVYDAVESKSIGSYVQEEVGIADRIFLTGALRLDENSSFGDDVAPRLYPKLAAAWLVSEESFWGLDAIPSLRIRGAWGKAGRPPAALAGHSTFIAIEGLADALAVRPATVGNPDIEPEVATELELGVDVSALDGRIAASFTRHSRRNEGAILEVNVPSSLGLSAPMAQNLGRIDAWGWEAQLHTRLYEGRAVSVGIDLAADHIDNEIVDLGRFPGTPSIALGLPYPNQLNDDLVLSATWDPGGPVISAFGERASAVCDAGVSLAPDPSAADASKYGRVKGGAGVPCQSIPNRNVIMGRAFATRTFSVAPRVGLFGDRLQLFAVAEGQYGRLRDANDREYSHVYRNSMVSRLQDDPEWVYGFAVGDDTKASLYDADFWKLREVGARFTVPAHLTRVVGAERATLSLSARNLWTIWQAQPDIYGVPISDPEYGSPSLDGDSNFYETPPLTNVSVTLRVTF